MRCIFFLLVLFPLSAYSQIVTNSTLHRRDNIYFDALRIVLEEYKEELKERIIVLDGDIGEHIYQEYLGFEIINTSRNSVYANENKKLTKEYKHLIGKDLVKMRFRPIYLENNRVYLRLYSGKLYYSSRKKYTGGIWLDGLWVFSYKYNCEKEGFEFYSVKRGIQLD